MISSPSDHFSLQKRISLPRVYAYAIGGMISCGLTHLAATPIDLVKYRDGLLLLLDTLLRVPAEVIANIVLCPMEAVKVRVQTQPGFARGLVDGLPKFVIFEGALGLYKGLVPLWKGQIPCLILFFLGLSGIVLNLGGNTLDILLQSGQKLSVALVLQLVALILQLVALVLKLDGFVALSYEKCSS
nr:mitochondrial phosphate carrier protein 3, mitochondrial-like [Tanacetum cinerariifolium]